MNTVKQVSANKLRTLVDAICDNQSTFSRQRLQSAVDLVERAYGQELYWTGETLLDHTVGTLQNLLAFEPDEDAVLVTILQHALHTKEVTLVQLEAEFGSIVKSLLADIHILSHVTLQGRRMTLHDLRLMVVSVAHDVRTVLITLASLTYVSSRMPMLSHEDRKQFCRDILHLFAPVAARLGIYSVKHELESSAFPVLYPDDYSRILDQYHRLFAENGSFFSDCTKALEEYLHAKEVTCRVFARQKLPFSVFMKMREKSLNHISDIPDLFAIRIVVPKIEDCYQVLGLLHQYANAVPHRFKDYIAFPKPNGYQSLHTTLVNVPEAPHTMMIEAQIRTTTMHREAEYGIAAHWSYKEVGGTAQAMQSVQLNRILTAQETLDDGSTEALADHIFVLTPRGDILELPEGSTPLDFAFLVHSDLGLSFKGARVNGAMVPLDYRLENGDVIEILKHSIPQPTAQWMQVVKTASARSKLKRYLYAQERPELLQHGKKLVNEQLRKRSLPVLDAELSQLQVLDGKKLTLTEREDVLVKIGQGAETSSALVARMLSETQRSHASVPATLAPKLPVHSERSLVLEGGLRMPYRFAKCCKAEHAHTDICGLVGRQGVVMIHRTTCSSIKKANSSRKLLAQYQ